MKLLIALTILFSFSSFAQANNQELIKDLRNHYEAKASELRFKNKHLYSTANYDSYKNQREQLKSELCKKDLLKSKAYNQARNSVIQQLRNLSKDRSPASLNHDALRLNTALKYYGCLKVSQR